MSSTEVATQIASITAVLFAAGLDGGLNIFDIPILQSQSAARSLPMIRWLFSRGSHTIPTSGLFSVGGFTYLAYCSLPAAQRSLTELIKVTSNSNKVNGYLTAAGLALSLYPLTQIMIPTNFALIKLNSELGGFRSEESAKQNKSASGSGDRNAVDSVYGQDEANQVTDLSGPQSKTLKDPTPEQEQEVQELLAKFKWLNWTRIVAMTASGVVGLYTALSL